jgi:hypothetical protein
VTTETSPTIIVDSRGRRRRGPHPLERIPLPNGDEAVRRKVLAAELRISERTLQRMNLPTLELAGCAFHPRRESLDVIAARIERPRPPQPAPAKRRGRR